MSRDPKIDLLIKTINEGEGSAIKDSRIEKSDPKSKQFEVLTFLQAEELRVSKLRDLFSKQFNMMENYPQLDTVLDDQLDYQEDLLILLNQKFKEEDNLFNKKLGRVWSICFSDEQE
ncbi:hypothetical protein N9O57_00720 [bacterium]|nr:hypothetical protein [bacterium]